MSNVTPIKQSNYRQVIYYSRIGGEVRDFTLRVFNSDTVVNTISELPNIAYRLFDDDPESVPVFARLDIHNTYWLDKSRYTELRNTIADILIQKGIDIGVTKYPNGLLEYLTADAPSVTIDLTTKVIRYNQGFYRWILVPVAHYVLAKPPFKRKHGLQTVTVRIDDKAHVLVDDTATAWSSFLATSYPKWFKDVDSYLTALSRAFKKDVKGTILEGVSFTREI